jgi:SPP1 gp7 family putative phage head morphogenesis protein
LSRIRVQPTEPSAAITARYTQVLQKFSSTLAEAVEAEIRKRFKRFVGDAEPDPNEVLRATIQFVERQTERFEDLAINVAAQAVKTGEAFNRQQFISNIKQGMGIDIKAVVDQQNIGPVLRRRVAKNVDLIKSIPDKYLSRVKDTLLAGIDRGEDMHSILATVKDLGEVSDRRAKFIARDQMNKLNADLAQARQRALGIESYIWRTAKDARVGDDHKHLEGRVFRWDDPPPTGHPGQRPNCRCVAEPNIREALGLALAA